MSLGILNYIDAVQRTMSYNIKQPHTMKFKIGDKVFARGAGSTRMKIVATSGINYYILDNGSTAHESSLYLIEDPLTLPSKDQILAAAEKNPCAKSTLEVLFPEVFPKKVIYNHDSIYATRYGTVVYKLCLGGFNWRFCCIGNSESHLKGQFKSGQIAIDYLTDAGYDVHEFSTQREFLQWAIEVTG